MFNSEALVGPPGFEITEISSFEYKGYVRGRHAGSGAKVCIWTMRHAIVVTAASESGQRAVLSDGKLTSTLAKFTLVDLVLHGASFTNIDMGRVKFDDVNLAGSELHNISLVGAKFSDVNLAGASFDDVNLEGVTIGESNIAGLTIQGHNIEELIRRAEQTSK